MNDTRSQFRSSLPPSQSVQFFRLCDAFEKDWHANKQPRIEDFVSEVAGQLQDHLLRELIAIEVELRQAQGEVVSAQEYLDRFPNQHNIVHDAFVPVPDHSSEQRVEDTRSIAATADTGPSIGTSESAREIPVQIDRYRVERVLGQGKFGVVYLAHDPQLDRPVAIKVSRKKRDIDARSDAFLTEGRVLASLDHPRIVPVYDVGRLDDGTCFVVSKYVQGSDLAERIQASRMPSGDAAKLVATVAEALHHAHKQGLVHRDIKPANILLDEGGQPHVADFGLALREEMFGIGPVLAGTPAYMSPEQARGEGHLVDGRSDIFSLGVVFYELLSGVRPFKGNTAADLLERVRSLEVKPPRQLDDTIPKELERICLKALSRRATDRYTTAEDMADDLRQFLRNTDSSDVPASDRGAKLKTAFKVNTPLLGCTLKASLVIGVCTLICICPPYHLWVRLTGLAQPPGRGPAFPEKNEALDLTCLVMIGLAAGWLAGKLGKGRNVSLPGTLMVGVIGALLGGFLFRIVDCAAIGLLGNLISAAVGAFVLLFVLQKIKG